MALLRKEGYIVGIVERWLPAVERRSDLFGFADLIAAHPFTRSIMLIQVTSAANVSARLSKSRSKPELAVWIRAGGAFEVHGWKQVDGRWRVRRVAVQLQDIDLTSVETQPLPRRRRRRKPAQQRDLFGAPRQDGAECGPACSQLDLVSPNGDLLLTRHLRHGGYQMESDTTPPDSRQQTVVLDEHGNEIGPDVPTLTKEECK